VFDDVADVFKRSRRINWNRNTAKAQDPEIGKGPLWTVLREDPDMIALTNA